MFAESSANPGRCRQGPRQTLWQGSQIRVVGCWHRPMIVGQAAVRNWYLLSPFKRCCEKMKERAKERGRRASIESLAGWGRIHTRIHTPRSSTIANPGDQQKPLAPTPDPATHIFSTTMAEVVLYSNVNKKQLLSVLGFYLRSPISTPCQYMKRLFFVKIG